MNVSMKDVAEKLGISQSTVSLALNNSPKISAATKQKVKAAAEELGYQSNPYVTALMSARRHGKNPQKPPVFAVVSAGRSPDIWKDRYNHKRFVEGCTQLAGSLGIRIEQFWIGGKGMTAKRLNDIFYNRGIRGVIIMPVGRYRDRLNYPWKDVSTISYGLYQVEPRTDWVATDYYGNMELARDMLVGEGFKRIGFAMDRVFPYMCDNRWAAAYLMGASRGQMKGLKIWQDPEPDYEGFRAWFRKTNPEVIICVHVPTIVEWLEQMGLKVPDDVSVVSIGAAREDGEFSGIVENAQACGKIAIETLLDRINRGDFGACEDIHEVKIGGHWNRGKTVRYSS